MKTYDHYDVVTNEDHDDWVPASVAQALYDLVADALEDETEFDTEWNKAARKALSLADGESE